jgi:SAM-dependent methyltransferase
MAVKYQVRRTCRLCDSTAVTAVVPIRPSPIADAYVPASSCHEKQDLYPLDLYLCRRCGHVQLLTVVDPHVLFREYLYTTSLSAGLVEHFRKYVDDFLGRFTCAPGALAVDVGSNDGTLLRFFQERGWRVRGVDPATEIARRATASGIETIPAFFTSGLAKEIRQHSGAAAVITANNVFAHSDSLPDMAEGVRELLADEGVFVFEVSYLLDIVEKLLFDTVYHEHLCYHSIAPLDRFFRSHGLELFDVVRLPTKGGSLRGFVQHRDGQQRRSEVVSELLAGEEGMGLARPVIFQQFSATIDAIGQQLRELLERLKNEGRVIAGYGASATVTTLIYHFQLAQYLDFLVDDNPSRQGLFSPGAHLPVLEPQALRERAVDYTVILAWQYADPIRQRNQAFLDRGGRFILPMPRVQVM